MLRFVEDRLNETQIPEIWETDEDKKLSDQELKKRNFKWALDNLRGKFFFNRSIKQNINVSRDGISEWKITTKSRDQALSMRLLSTLLEIADFWKEGPHVPPDPNIEKVIYFRQHCKINGTDYTAVITVKAYKSQNYRKYYHHFLDDFLVEPKK